MHNCRRTVIFIIIFIFIISWLFSSENSWQVGNEYRGAKIRLKSGEILKRTFTVIEGNSISYYSMNLGKDKNVSLENIEKIEVPAGDLKLVGGVFGVVAGIVASIIVQSKLEEPIYGEDSPDVIPWWADEYSYEHHYGSESKLEYKMAFAPKIFIVGGSTCIGIIFGSLIKTSWKTLYPESDLDEKLTINFAPKHFVGEYGINLEYKF